VHPGKKTGWRDDQQRVRAEQKASRSGDRRHGIWNVGRLVVQMFPQPTEEPGSTCGGAADLAMRLIDANHDLPVK
jgi:hypothetical protein